MKIEVMKKINRIVAIASVGVVLVGGNTVPLTKANANEAMITPVPEVSAWSIPVLSEGEKYGIYPLRWYYDGTFKKPITADKLKSLLDAMDTKLDAIGYKQEPVTFNSNVQGITRKDFVSSLYQLLSSYELPSSFDLSTNDSIDYMTKAKLIQGTNLGLELDKPITVEQAAVIASRMVEYVYDQADAGAKGLFWKVTKDDNTVYLLGSIHLGIPEMYPMDKEIRQAFEASEELWVEANIFVPDTSAAALLSYQDGTTLKDHISAETYSKLQQVLTKLGVPVNTFDIYKPSVIANNLSMTGFFDTQDEQAAATNAGVDSYFLTKAMLMKKPIHELEGLEFQYNLLYNKTDQEQEQELAGTLENILSGYDMKQDKKVVEQKQLDWAKGDLEGYIGVTSEVQQSDESGLTDKLIGERDTKMAKKISELLEREGKHTSFVIVGADHYATKGMVVDQLRDKRYDVKFID